MLFRGHRRVQYPFIFVALEAFIITTFLLALHRQDFVSFPYSVPLKESRFLAPTDFIGTVLARNGLKTYDDESRKVFFLSQFADLSLVHGGFLLKQGSSAISPGCLTSGHFLIRSPPKNL